MKVKNYYKILGVKKTASTADIKDRFKKMVKLFDPNKHPNNKKVEIKYRELIEAYKVLGNLESRLEYAQLFHTDRLFQEKVAITDYQFRKANKVK